MTRLQTVQYARAMGARVIGIDGGSNKGDFLRSIGAEAYVDIQTTADAVSEVQRKTVGGADAVVVTAGNAKAFVGAAEMLRIGGTLSCVGIPPGRAMIVRRGVVKPNISVRKFQELPRVYEELEKGEIAGRVVLKVAEDDKPIRARL